MNHNRYLLLKQSILVILFSFFFFQHGFSQNNSGGNAQAVYDLIERILPGKSGNFIVELTSPSNEKDIFEIESANGKIVLRGNNGISVSSALNYYLKNYANCHISWNGSNLNLPEPLPVVPQKVRIESPYKFRYYFNYCTFNYTASWWDWERWQKEIDFMALNGINMPLALTGQNAVWQRVYKNMGLTDKDLAGFFPGPAYFAWFWMGNLDGYNGPLPQAWIDKHEELQKKILQRERELGMTPILPAFSGHVPPAFKEKFPSSKIIKTKWDANGFGEVYAIDPEDTMFTYVGSKFLEEQTRTYGTDHYYSSDTFNENEPPSKEPAFLRDVSAKVYQSMKIVDPDAVWVMQGWLFYNNIKFWQPEQAKALLSAIPDDKMIILDLFTESYPVWQKTEAFYGKTWIWCMLHNFGGNNNLYGDMNNIANGPLNTLKDSKSGNMTGIGITAEAIELNPALYEMMLDNSWRNENINIVPWINKYIIRRYGSKNDNAEKAWNILLNTVYGKGMKDNYHCSFIMRPELELDIVNKEGELNVPYNTGSFVPAWEYLIKASDDLNKSEGFRYDLVDVTRQVLVNYGNKLMAQMRQEFVHRNVENYKKLSIKYLEVFEDLDKLLSSQNGFLLGAWIHDAKKWGTTKEEIDLYEKNARNLVTLWGDKDSPLHDYSRRQWGGLLKDFYKPRWEKFIAYAINSLEKNSLFSQKEINEEIKDLEWGWVNSINLYPKEPTGDPVELAKEIFNKYDKEVNEAFILE